VSGSGVGGDSVSGSGVSGSGVDGDSVGGSGVSGAGVGGDSVSGSGVSGSGVSGQRVSAGKEKKICCECAKLTAGKVHCCSCIQHILDDGKCCMEGLTQKEHCPLSCCDKQSNDDKKTNQSSCSCCESIKDGYNFCLTGECQGVIKSMKNDDLSLTCH
jgi:hypothetical protein